MLAPPPGSAPDGAALVATLSVADLGGHKGCPPGHPNSFDFMQFSRKCGKIVCCPPRGVGAPQGNPGSVAAFYYLYLWLEGMASSTPLWIRLGRLTSLLVSLVEADQMTPLQGLFKLWMKTHLRWHLYNEVDNEATFPCDHHEISTRFNEMTTL